MARHPAATGEVRQMIILDTNVLSALMKPIPDPGAVAWLDNQPSESIWTTAVTVFEIEFGMALLPAGRRRLRLQEIFGRVLHEELQDRILAFDHGAAVASARLAADRQRAGRPVDFRDTEIAGIAIAHRATVATRNVRHFSGMGVPVVDPWTALAGR
jgi:predicted nucleic acid-binding protein